MHSMILDTSDAPPRACCRCGAPAVHTLDGRRYCAACAPWPQIAANDAQMADILARRPHVARRVIAGDHPLGWAVAVRVGRARGLIAREEEG